MMIEDDVSESVAFDNSSQLDIEDGISFASSQQVAAPSEDNPVSLLGLRLNRPLAGDNSSHSTPILRNPYEKQVGFEDMDDDDDDDDDDEDDDGDGDGDGDDDQKRGGEKLSPVDEENAKLDLEITKIENQEDQGNTGTYDLGAYDLSKPQLPNDDDQTSDTPHRSGSSEYVLHTWMKRKDWTAVRQFFKNPPRDSEKLHNAIHYANDDGETPLHIACRKKAPYDIIKKITEHGGKKTVLACNTYGNSTPLHHACHFNTSPKVVEHLIIVGGVEAARKIDDIGNLPIHWALSKRLPNRNIKQLIEMGGFDTTKVPNRIGWTALHTSCYFDANTELIKYLVGIVGPGMVRTLDKKQRTPLDLILERNSFCVESINLLLHSLGELDQTSLHLPQNTINATLEWARRQPDSTALECLFVQRVLNESFISRKYLTVWMIDVYFQILLVVMFSFGIDDSIREYGIAINPSAAAAFYCSISWFLGRELVQLMTTPFNDFFKDFKNWLDFAQVIFVFMSLDILVFKGGVQSSEDVSIITCTAGLVWFTLLSVLGKAFYRIRVFIVYLQMLIWNLASFFICSVCIVAAFAQMYYITNNFLIGTCTRPMFYVEDQDWTCSLGDTYFMTFSSILNGHWRFMQQPSGSPMTILSFTLGLFTILFLFTSLIGQVVSLNDRIQEHGMVSFWRNRLTTIIEISDFNEIFGCGCCKKDLAHNERGLTVDGDKDRLTAEYEETNIPISRFTFSKAEKYRSFPEDEDNVRDWWMGNEERVPPFKSRMRYFVTWAPVSEIIIPGRELERALGGHDRDTDSYFLRVATYIFFPLSLALLLLVFLSGLVTLGLLWPREMRKRIFCGTESLPGKHKEEAARIRTEVIKNGVEAIRVEMKADHLAKEALENDVKKLQSTLNEMTKLIKSLGDDSTTNGSEYMADSYDLDYA